MKLSESHDSLPSRIAFPHGGQRNTTLLTSPRTTDSVSLRHSTHGPLIVMVPGAIGVYSLDSGVSISHSGAELRFVVTTARPPIQAIPERESVLYSPRSPYQGRGRPH